MTALLAIIPVTLLAYLAISLVRAAVILWIASGLELGIWEGE